jgi:hypothetical protein
MRLKLTKKTDYKEIIIVGGPVKKLPHNYNLRRFLSTHTENRPAIKLKCLRPECQNKRPDKRPYCSSECAKLDKKRLKSAENKA